MAETMTYPMTRQGVRDLDNPIRPGSRTGGVNVGPGERTLSTLAGAALAGLGLGRRGTAGLLLAAAGRHPRGRLDWGRSNTEAIMRLLPALILGLVLTATGAPLPFPRTPSALKQFQGEWGVSEMSVDAAPSLTGLPARLGVSVKRDRLRLYHEGKPASEWVISPDPEPVKGGLALRLTSARGVAARTGRYSAEMDSLTLMLTGEDIGLPRPSKYLGYAPPRVVLTLTRKAS
jgi:hypothetical protein